MNDANSLGGKIETTGKELLERLAQPVPHFTELLPKICYQFIKGECLKGDKCELRYINIIHSVFNYF